VNVEAAADERRAGKGKANLRPSTRYEVNLKPVSVAFTFDTPCKHTYPEPPKGSLPRQKRFVAYIIAASRLSKMLTAIPVTEVSCVVESSAGAGSGLSSPELVVADFVTVGGVVTGGVSMSPANAGQQNTSNRTAVLRDFRIILFLCGIIRWAYGHPRARESRFSVPANFLQGQRRAYLT
jgi:hypothetical protein